MDEKSNWWKTVNKSDPAMGFFLGMLVGFGLGNFLPDPTDYLYWSAIASGTILDPLTSFMVYYGFSFLFWEAVTLLLFIGWRQGAVHLREATWTVSAIIIGSTALLLGTVSNVMGEYAVFFDVLMCVACLFSILYVEGKLTFSNIKGFFTRSYR